MYIVILNKKGALFMDIMAKILDILDTINENEYFSQMQEQYRQCKKEISELPRGSIVIKKRGSKQYIYHNHYSDTKKKFIDEYIGEGKHEMQELIERRQRLEKVAKNLEDDITAIERILKIVNKRIQQESVRGKLEEMSANQDASKVSQSQTNAIDIQKAKETTLIERREH